MKKTLKLLKFLVLFSLLTHCDKERDNVNESALEEYTPAVLSEKVNFQQSEHFNKVNSKIKSLETKLNKTKSSKSKEKETDSLIILKDEVLYITYAGTHTYTFKIARKNSVFLMENIVLHYNLNTELYDEYLVQYTTNIEDIEALNEGVLFEDSEKVVFTKLEAGFFELHSADNSNTIKKGGIICKEVTSTEYVSCSSGQHTKNNLGDWSECIADDKPYAYQSTKTVCGENPDTNPPEETDTGSGGGGGGNNPDVVIYNPLPKQPCDSNAEVDGNGNCIQPLDIAVSEVVNCLSTNASTALSQREINYLFSSANTYKIQSYLATNGCSFEVKGFSKSAIEILSIPIVTSANIADYKDVILRMTKHLKEFGAPEDEFFAGYIESIVPDFNLMTVGDVDDIYLLTRTQVHELTFKFAKAIVVPFAEAAYPFVVYALTDATLGAALPLLSRIPLSMLTRGTRLEKMVKQVGLLGVQGNAGNHIRIVTTSNPIQKAEGLFASLTKNAISKTTQSNGTIVANMGNGNKIIFRPSSASSSGFKATIDLDFRASGIWTKTRNVKFQ